MKINYSKIIKIIFLFIL